MLALLAQGRTGQNSPRHVVGGVGAREGMCRLFPAVGPVGGKGQGEGLRVGVLGMWLSGTLLPKGPKAGRRGSRQGSQCKGGQTARKVVREVPGGGHRAPPTGLQAWGGLLHL